MNKVSLIIQREYITRVSNKRFLLMTILMPLIFIVFIFGSAFFAASIKEETKIAIATDPGFLKEHMKSEEGDVTFEFTSGVDSLNYSTKGFDAVMYPAIENEKLIANIHSKKQLGLEKSNYIDRQLNKAVENNLLNDFGYTHDELANKLSKSRPVITNTMRLLNLPASVQRKVAAGVISAGHARALLSLTDQSEIENLANKIVAEGLTVRSVEEIVASGGAKVASGSIKRGKIIAPKIKQISDQLSDQLDTRVNIELGKKKGKIVIEFAAMEDLERIHQIIKGK